MKTIIITITITICLTAIPSLFTAKRHGNSSEHPKAFQKSYSGGSIFDGSSATALEQSCGKHYICLETSDLNRNFIQFYSASHFVSTISLYLDFYIVSLQITFIYCI